MYSFKRLIEKYSTTCQLISKTEGKWDAGVWQDGNTAVTDIKGAVVPITEKRIQNSGGTYKQGDCEFITTETIDTAIEAFLVYKGKTYKLEDSTDYSEYADFNTYVARRVSGFDTTGSDTANNT